jgi:hypothetical protein
MVFVSEPDHDAGGRKFGGGKGLAGRSAAIIPPSLPSGPTGGVCAETYEASPEDSNRACSCCSEARPSRNWSSEREMWPSWG